MINNQGEIDKNLTSQGNSNTSRVALAVTITTGAMTNVAGLDRMQDLANGSEITNELIFNLIDVSGRTLTS